MLFGCVYCLVEEMRLQMTQIKKLRYQGINKYFPPFTIQIQGSMNTSKAIIKVFFAHMIFFLNSLTYLSFHSPVYPKLRSVDSLLSVIDYTLYHNFSKEEKSVIPIFAGFFTRTFLFIALFRAFENGGDLEKHNLLSHPRR